MGLDAPVAEVSEAPFLTFCNRNAKALGATGQQESGLQDRPSAQQIGGKFDKICIQRTQEFMRTIKGGQMDPLPTKLEEFRSREYWDSFFRKLDKKAFEWYGEWAELRDLVMSACSPGLDILVAGCGNSELSALVYDQGCTRVTNIDFSKVCIVEMLKKNVRARPKMRWLVMDMTKMQFPDASFDVIIDKGGLDALTGEPGDEGASAGAAFLKEVKRVLRPGSGRYLCVSLAQKHVIDLLLTTLGPGWHVTIHQVPLPADGSDSPFRTYFLDVRSMATSPSAGRRFYPVTLAFDKAQIAGTRRAGSEITEARESQLRDLMAAVARFNERCSRQQDACQPLEPAADDFEAYHPGRRAVCYLGLDNQVANPTQSRARYTATVLDAASTNQNGTAAETERKHSGTDSSSSESSASTSMGSAPARAHRCAVFLVPQGREHEWLFASEEGQWQLVEQASAARLILVTLNRGHRFGSSEEVQSELSPLVEGLAPLPCRRERRVIPYLTTNDGIGKRTILDEAESQITGPIVVEDVELDSGSQGTFRRLVFTRNQNLVQSEAALTSPPTSANGDAASKKKGGRKGGGQRGEVGERAVDHSLLTSEYHAAMVAGLALVMPLLEGYEETNGMARVLVIGLGGGGLPMFLHNHLPLRVKVVELDPVVAQMAQRHFGFVEDDRMQLEIGDGLKAVHAITASVSTANGTPPCGNGAFPSENHQVGSVQSTDRPRNESSPVNRTSERNGNSTGNGASPERPEGARDQRLDVLFIDVDAGDASLSMSCPAPAFLEKDFLLTCRAALRDGGMFVVNVVSRAAAPYASACAILKEVFHDVYEFDVDGDVNRILFALRRTESGQISSRSLSESAAQLLRMGKNHGPWGRGPLLTNLAEGIKKLA
ncbi:S-adenosyl-L-methionine dependent methyltransferases [Klebsormidium nitens]|uniref:S-adenosyl-L-methionine dependent methyltransferases n=1 Tax=Klebsormidium nitens TaxID=105231 RepID=A0A1Y1IA33_KLENI|nr:S-adenosyl-L-methionine dependent methyltransferases [Klebsormidium nitens]|eukprot:GAQ85556.1 S-adenosyl-L-methionine dependent methyltransferases [Klebsormidium nitens]